MVNNRRGIVFQYRLLCYSYQNRFRYHYVWKRK